MAKPEAPISEPQVPAWVDELYYRLLDEGHAFKAIVISPHQPVSRKQRQYNAGLYDYDGEPLPYASESDAHYAEQYRKIVDGTIKLHGEDFVKVIPLPSEFNTIDPKYRHSEHRLLMIGCSPVRGWIENALSERPRSPSEVLNNGA